MKYTMSIKKNKTFRYILKKGKYCVAKQIVVYILENRQEKDKNFLGICVNKKNGGSVERNRLKRWVREVLKMEESILKKGYQIIVLFRDTATVESVDFNIIKEQIKYCFDRLNIYEK